MNGINLKDDINLLNDTIKKYQKLLNLKKVRHVRNELLFKMLTVYIMLFVPFFVCSWITKLPMIAFIGSIISLLSLIIIYMVITNRYQQEVLVFINNNPDIDYDHISYKEIQTELSKLQTKLIALNSVMNLNIK